MAKGTLDSCRSFRLGLIGLVAEVRTCPAFSSDAGIHCYLFPEGTMEWSASKPADICELKFSGDEQSVLVSFTDGSCNSYDAQSGVQIK